MTIDKKHLWILALFAICIFFPEIPRSFLRRLLGDSYQTAPVAVPQNQRGAAQPPSGRMMTFDFDQTLREHMMFSGVNWIGSRFIDREPREDQMIVDLTNNWSPMIGIRPGNVAQLITMGNARYDFLPAKAIRHRPGLSGQGAQLGNYPVFQVKSATGRPGKLVIKTSPGPQM